MKKSWMITLMILLVCCAVNFAAGEQHKELLRIIEINMGQDKKVTNSMYDEYFLQENAEKGVRDIIAAGRFVINGFAIPATAEDLDANWPQGYLLNQESWLEKTDTGYHVDKKDFTDYEDAALYAATDFDAGLEVRLYDETGDGKTDLIEMDYVGSVIVNKILDNGDGTYSIRRAEIDPSTIWENDGTAFEGEHFTQTSGEIIPAANLDPSLQEGEMGLFWYGPDGWAIKRATEVRGILVDGEDHEFYQMDDIRFEDAMRFSRGNIITSNRCGEFVNAQKYFGFNNNSDGLTVSLWFNTTSDASLWAAPAGFTSGENSSVFLEKAISIAKDKLESVVVSEDGENVADGINWVHQDVYDALEKAIGRAEDALMADLTPELNDYHVYLLYFALNGSGDDIGAVFSGYDYPGFEKQYNGATVEKVDHFDPNFSWDDDGGEGGSGFNPDFSWDDDGAGAGPGFNPDFSWDD